jgi:hypothetical protein
MQSDNAAAVIAERGILSRRSISFIRNLYTKFWVKTQFDDDFLMYVRYRQHFLVHEKTS